MINGKVNELSITKILGLQWDKVSDTIIFDMKKTRYINDHKTNKKGVHSVFCFYIRCDSSTGYFKCLA